MLKCKERVIEEVDEKRVKVKFFKGVKQVLKNKYMWIIESSKILGTWMNIFGGVLQLWFVYSLRMEWFVGIAANLVVLSMTFGNLLTPWLIKKYEKKTIIIWVRIFSLGCILMMYGAILIPSGVLGVIVFMTASFIKNFFHPIEQGVFNGLSADALDYHQCKYGERADGMIQVFGWIFGPFVMAISFVLPFLLERAGYTSDWDVLYNTDIIISVFNIYIWLSFISLSMTIVPFLFYNLTREKHANCIKEMEERIKASNGEIESSCDDDENESLTNDISSVDSLDIPASCDNSISTDEGLEHTELLVSEGLNSAIDNLKGADSTCNVINFSGSPCNNSLNDDLSYHPESSQDFKVIQSESECDDNSRSVDDELNKGGKL